MKRHRFSLLTLFMGWGMLSLSTIAQANGVWHAFPEGAAVDDVVAYAGGYTEVGNLSSVAIYLGDGASDWKCRDFIDSTFLGQDGVQYSTKYIQAGTNGWQGSLMYSNTMSAHIKLVPYQVGTIYIAAKYGKYKPIWAAKVPNDKVETLDLSDMTPYLIPGFSEAVVTDSGIVMTKAMYINETGTGLQDVEPSTDVYAALPLEVTPGYTYYFWASRSKIMLCGIHAESVSYTDNGIIYIVSNDMTAKVVGYNDTLPSIIEIPSTITFEGITCDVTSIGHQAFFGCTALTSVTIPESVTSIGERAFYGCKGLTSVSLPRHTNIGKYAFYNCSSLQTCRFHDQTDKPARNEQQVTDNTQDTVFFVNSMGWEKVYAFGWGGNIEGNPWPGVLAEKSAKQWNDMDIYYFVANEGDYNYCIFNNGGIGSSNQTVDLVWESGKYFYNGEWYSFDELMPTYSIGAFAFAGCSALSAIDIPEGFAIIEESAFSDCSILSSVTIPTSLAKIGTSVFYNCLGLTTVVWNATNCSNDAGESRAYYIFSDANAAITSMTIGETVEVIPPLLCYNMTNIRSITIPGSVRTIGWGAFEGCTGLTSVTVPESVTSIGERAFGGCSSLTKLICEGYTDNTKNAISNCYALDTIVISAHAFDVEESNWSSMPKNIRYIKLTGGELTDNAFNVILRNYKTLGTLDLEATANTTLSDETFKGCYNLQTLSLPSELTAIPYMAVAECVNLQSIIIPATVTDIEQRAFENCRSLSALTFEDGIALERIGSWAFYNCHDLQSIVIPEGVTEIGNAAFYGCNYLQDLTLPSTLRKIGDNTFALCSKLQQMHVSALVPPTAESKTFLDVLRTIPVIVPDEAVEDYKAAAVWQEFNIVGESDAPMSIDNARSTDAQGVQKLLRDGQVLILRNGETYNMMGQRL